MGQLSSAPVGLALPMVGIPFLRAVELQLSVNSQPRHCEEPTATRQSHEENTSRRLPRFARNDGLLMEVISKDTGTERLLGQADRRGGKLPAALERDS